AYSGAVSGEDGINPGDTLTLTFAHAVTLVGLHFYDTDHTGTDFGDYGTVSIDGGITKTIGLASYVTSDSSHWSHGKSFTFGYKSDNDTPYGYYVGAVDIAAPVPEPQTYALMFA